MGTFNFKKSRSENNILLIVFSLVCLGISLFIHAFFLVQAGRLKMPGFSPESYDTIVPRTFRMKRVEIDPKTLEDTKVVEKETPQKQPIEIEKERPQANQQSPAEEDKDILLKPSVNIPVEKPDTQTQAAGLDQLLKKSEDKMNGTEEIAMEKGPDSTLKLPASAEGGEEEGGGNTGKGGRQFSTLDDLLAGTGTVKKNTAPILMPTDLLFEYDAATLKPEAAQTLAKLGSLIKKNAQAVFKIEGYTDSFGSDDYNISLSVRRAEAVKAWLLTNMGLDPTRISTVGLGKSRLLVPATGTVQQQQLNRRVEIVISVPK